MTAREISVYADRDHLVSAAADEIARIIANLTSSQAQVDLAITGGTVGTLTLEAIAERTEDLDLSKLHVWWVDERFVSSTSIDRNDLQARAAWLSGSSIPNTNIHPFPASDSGAIDEAAATFAKTIEATNPEFDLVILGMGEDGHVASLFPNSSASVQGGWIVVEKSSPKPPIQRLSLSFAALNKAKEVLFLVSGLEKASAVKDVMSGISLPASQVHGINRTRWLLDKESASLITFS